MLNQNYSRYCAVSFIRIEHSSMLGKASLHSKTLREYSFRDHVIDIPFSPNQFLALDFFAASNSKMALVQK